MTKTVLINKIITLGMELETSEGIQASMIVNDMELAIDKYVKELNPLNK